MSALGGAERRGLGEITGDPADRRGEERGERADSGSAERHSATISQTCGGRLEEPLDPANVHEVDLERADRLRDRAREVLRLELALDFPVVGEHAECGIFEDVRRDAVEEADEAKRLDRTIRARQGLAPQEAFSKRSHARIVESESNGSVPRTRYP
jgi:hypothetical protein